MSQQSSYAWASLASGQLYEQAHHDAKISEQAVAQTILELLPNELAKIEQQSRRQLKKDRLNTVRYLFPEPEGRATPAVALAEIQPERKREKLSQDHAMLTRQSDQSFCFSAVQETCLVKAEPVFLLGQQLSCIYQAPQSLPAVAEQEEFTEEYALDQDWSSEETTSPPTSAPLAVSTDKLPAGGLWLAIRVPDALVKLDGLQLYFGNVAPEKARLLGLAKIINYEDLSWDSLLEKWEATDYEGPIDKEGLMLRRLQRQALAQFNSGLLRLSGTVSTQAKLEKPNQLPSEVTNQLAAYDSCNLLVLAIQLPPGLESSDFVDCVVSSNVLPVWNVRRLHLQSDATEPVSLRLPTQQSKAEVGAEYQFLAIEQVYLPAPFQLIQQGPLNENINYGYELLAPSTQSQRQQRLREQIAEFLALSKAELAEEELQIKPQFGPSNKLFDDLEKITQQLNQITNQSGTANFLRVEANGHFFHVDYLVTQVDRVLYDSENWQCPKVLELDKETPDKPLINRAFLIAPPVGGRPPMSESQREAFVKHQLTLPSNTNVSNTL